MADVYRVGVAISLTNNVSAALKVIQRDVLGLGRTVDLTQGKFDHLKKAVFGAGAAFVGVGALSAFKGLAEAGGEVLNAQAKMLQVGISVRDLTQETAVAMQNIGIAGTTLAGNINSLNTLRGILGGKNAADFSAANAALPGYAQAQFALSSRGIDPGQLDQFVKALDFIGAFNTNGKIDPSKFGPALQEAISAVLTTNGLLTGQGFYQAARLSGPAASAMGETAYLQNMVEILLALGNRGARGLEYGATTFLGGQMSKNSAAMLDRLRLTTPSDYTHEGGRYSLDPGKIAGDQMLSAGNIIGWIQSYFLPAVKQSGLSVLQASATLPQTLQLLISTVSNMSPQMARSVQQQAQAQTADPYTAAMKALTGATGDFESALTGLWQVLGQPAAVYGVRILNTLSAGIRDFTQWVGAHPTLADAMVKVLGLVGAGLTGLGVILTGTAIASAVGGGGTLALVALGLGGLAGALYELPTYIKEVNAAFQATIQWTEGVAQSLERFLGISAGPHPLVPTLPGTSWPPVQLPADPSHYGHDGRLGEADPQVWGPKLALWIDNGAPVTVAAPVTVSGPVTIGNTGDIARGANAYGRKMLQAPNTGASGVNLRLTPSGSAALAMPGYG
jgi:hypothetical protein